MWTKLAFASVLFGIAACTSATQPSADLRVAGTWAYAGTQDAPDVSSLSGSLNWHAAPDAVGAFEGNVALSEVASGVNQRSLHGVSAGMIHSDSVADFDIVIAGAARRHLGILRGDSITGAWVSISGGTNARGRFTLRRSVPAP